MRGKCILDHVLVICSLHSVAECGADACFGHLLLAFSCECGENAYLIMIWSSVPCIPSAECRENACLIMFWSSVPCIQSAECKANACLIMFWSSVADLGGNPGFSG